MKLQAQPPLKPVVYYRDAGFLVTSAKVKSPRKTYRVDKIEKVSIRRDLYFLSLAFTIFLILFLLKFGWITGYPHAFFILYISIVITYITKQISMLFITSKAVSELAFIGLNDRLEKVRDGIERAMHNESNDDGLGVEHGDDHESDDE